MVLFFEFLAACIKKEKLKVGRVVDSVVQVTFSTAKLSGCVFGVECINWCNTRCSSLWLVLKLQVKSAFNKRAAGEIS